MSNEAPNGEKPNAAHESAAGDVAGLRALVGLFRELRDVRELSAVLARACELACGELGWERAAVILADATRDGRADVAAAVGFDDAGLDALRARFGSDDVEATTVAIDAEGETVGALVVEGRDASARDRETLETLADLVAAAVGEDRLEARLRAAARESTALYRASALLVDTTDLDRLLEKMLDAIDEHFGHPIITIHLREPGSDLLVRRAARGHEPNDRSLYHRLEGPSIVARVGRTGDVAHVDDVVDDPDYVQTIEGTVSELAVPLRVDGEVLGVVNVESPRPAAFSESDRRILASFADHAGVAVRAARLNERLRVGARRDALVNTIVGAASRTHDLDEIMRLPCEGLTDALGVQRAYVGVVDWSAMVARFTHGYSADGTELFSGSFPLAAMPELSTRLWNDEAVAVADVFDEPMLRGARWSYERHDTRALVYQPVARLGDWHAVLLVCSNRVRHWMPDELEFLRSVAEHLGSAFAQAELFARVDRAKREWETTFDTMSDGVLLVDAAHAITGANAAAAAMFQRPRSELVGMSCCEALAAGANESCPAHRSFSTSRRVSVQTTPSLLGRETQITIDPIADGGGVVVVLRDVSELRRVEADARRQSVVLSQLVATSSDPIAMLDTDGRVVWCNAALEEAAGIEGKAILGMRLVDVLAPDFRDTAEIELAHVVRGEPRFFETALGGRGGPEVSILATLTPVVDDRALEGTLLVGRDVTGHRRAAERAAAADKLRALGQLASGVAHNFNNALAVILGRTQLIRRRTKDDRTFADLAVVEQVAHEASSTVRRIQEFARRRRHESFLPVDMRALVEDTVEMTSTRWHVEANALGVRYTVGVEPGAEDVRVLGNESELREVLINILFNALDAMPIGGRVSISLARTGGFVAVNVTDEGSGMDDDVQRRVFEPFFTTKGVSGTGLGLAVSYGIVSRHEGRIEVDSQVGRGTTFTILVPALATATAAAAIESTVETASVGSVAAEIVVVDDDESVMAVVSEALEGRGHSVRCAPSAVAALRLMRESAAAMLITDLSMPDVNGLALARTVREQWPQCRIVLMSGADITAPEAVPDDGSVDFVIAKPFKLEELCFLVESALGPVGVRQDRG